MGTIDNTKRNIPTERVMNYTGERENNASNLMFQAQTWGAVARNLYALHYYARAGQEYKKVGMESAARDAWIAVLDSARNATYSREPLPKNPPEEGLNEVTFTSIAFDIRNASKELAVYIKLPRTKDVIRQPVEWPPSVNLEELAARAEKDADAADAANNFIDFFSKNSFAASAYESLGNKKKELERRFKLIRVISSAAKTDFPLLDPKTDREGLLITTAFDFRKAIDLLVKKVEDLAENADTTSFAARINRW